MKISEFTEEIVGVVKDSLPKFTPKALFVGVIVHADQKEKEKINFLFLRPRSYTQVLAIFGNPPTYAVASWQEYAHHDSCWSEGVVGAIRECLDKMAKKLNKDRDSLSLKFWIQDTQLVSPKAVRGAYDKTVEIIW